MKTDSNGRSQWNQTYGGGEDDEAYALLQTTDGGYILAGRTGSFGTGGYDYWLVKTDSHGIPQWDRTYGGAKNDSAWALIQTTDGGYALTGETDSYGARDLDWWLVKTDSQGILQWNRTYGGRDDDSAHALIQTPDGGYALGGWTGSFGAGWSDFWLVKTDRQGIPQWNRTYGGGDYDYARALIQTPDGGYALAGWTKSYGAGDYDYWLVKTDSNGTIQWNQTYGGVRSNYARALIQTPDGGYALVGTTTPSGAGSIDSWLVKTDGNGIPQWDRRYGGVGYDSAYALIQTPDGGYALGGWTTGYSAGDYDFWLVKTKILVTDYYWSDTFTKTEGMVFPITVFSYLAIVVTGSSVGLLTSRLVYRRYKKWRQKKATSKGLREEVNNRVGRIPTK
ncbi:MAG: hypothetical protein ACFFCZ_21940 [Promethearchaeota archaeon]